MYECHLTYEEASPYTKESLKRYANECGWKFSAIDGDPVLGKGVKLYLTCHDKSVRSLFRKMREATTTGRLPRPIREKIERIVHDPLYGVELPKGQRR